MTTPPFRAPGSRRRAGLAVVPLLLVGLLTACSGLQPGIAAEVGEDRITVADVDADSALLCTAVEDTLEQPLPMSLARQQVLDGLVRRSIADQIADEYDVEPGGDYASAVSQATTQAASYPAETRDTIVTVATSTAYVQSILDAAARRSLADEGLDDPQLSQVDERGQDLLASWPDSHTLEIDPRFGLEFVEGAFASAETGVSFPISETARAGTAENSDQAAAQTAALPASQRCG